MQTVCIFAKAPEKGRVKTRLAANLGDDVAMQVYRALLEHTAQVMSQWQGNVRLFIDGDGKKLQLTPLGVYPMTAQKGNNLGARLLAGVTDALAQSPTGVVVLGTDCPRLTINHVNKLAQSLSTSDVAIGPARDGGYWGIAIKNVAAAKIVCAEDLPWSTPTLMMATRKRLSAAKITCGHGELLDDLDTVADLNRAEASGFRWQHQGTT
jgi:uncharacterized protein